MITPQLSQALGDWLAQGRARRGYSEKTVEAYRADVTGFLAFLAAHNGGAEGVAGVARLAVSDLRAFMAHERARGISARSLARRLSAVRGSSAATPARCRRPCRTACRSATSSSCAGRSGALSGRRCTLR